MIAQIVQYSVDVKLRLLVGTTEYCIDHLANSQADTGFVNTEFAALL
jgi:hypothetical protein